MDLVFSQNELITIYGTVKHMRDVANDLLDKMNTNDPERSAMIENNKVYNSILRKLNNLFKENSIELKGL